MRFTIPITPGDDAELVAARLWQAGAAGVQEEPHQLTAWFDQRSEDVPPGGSWTVEPEQDWLATWREGIEPVRAGRVVVVPSWLAEDHTPGVDEVTLLLDPGVAFGSGHHATTQLCLELLQEHLRPGATVLDVGCGTGVLSIAAALLGAGHVLGVDVDGDAVHATRVNARANDVTVEARLGSVDSTDVRADVVLANLLTPTLHALATQLRATVADGGVLIASGVASERADDVAAALADTGLPATARHDRDGWAALVHTAGATS